MGSLSVIFWLLGSVCFVRAAAGVPQTPPDWVQRGAAVSAATTCTPALQAGLEDTHWYVRACAIQTAGRLGCAAVVPALMARFDAEDWDNQARILAALGSIGHQAGFELVARVAETTDAGLLRRTALAALAGFDTALGESVVARVCERPLTTDEQRIVAQYIARFQCRGLSDRLAAWVGQDVNLDRDIALARYRTGDRSAGTRVIADFTHFDAAFQRLLLEDWARQPDPRAAPVVVQALRFGPSSQRPVAARAWAAYAAQAPLTETLDLLPLVADDVQMVLAAAVRQHPPGDLVAAVIERLTADASAPSSAAQTAYLNLLASHDRDAVVEALLTARPAHPSTVDRALGALGVTPEALHAQLDNPNLTATQRIKIALQLGQLGDGGGLAALQQSLVAADAPTRRATVEALARLGDDRAVELLPPVLDDADPSVRAAAVAALAHFGVTPERLVERLASPNSALRAESLRLLGSLGNAAHVPQLAAHLRPGEPLAVRLAAAAALGRLRRPESVTPLMAALEDPDPALRRQVVWALGDIGDEQATTALLRLLQNRDTGLVVEAIRVLAKTQSAAAAPLLEALRHADWRVRAAAAQGLGDRGDPQVLPALVGALNDPSALVRFYVRQALLRQGVVPSADLLAILDHRTARGWYGAYELLRQLAPEAARPELLRRLESDELGSRAVAAALLCVYRDTDTLEALLHRLDRENRFLVRWWLARSIAAFGEAARAPAVKRARAKQPRLQADALRILGLLSPDPDSQTLLRAALASPDAQVRAAGVEALGRTGDVDTLARLLSPQAGSFTVTPDELTEALLACGEAGRSALRRAVAGSDAAVRAVLLHRLGEDGNPDVLPLLLEATRDPSPLVRQAAYRGLARQSDERAAQALATAAGLDSPH